MSSHPDRSASHSCEPLGLYVHVPFCHSKCGYCDFYSVAVEGRDTAALVDRIIIELRQRLARAGRDVSTVFFGGGTPTILPPDELAALLEAVEAHVPVGDLDEFTVEANPATVDEEKAELLLAHGVTRVSMGAQSFFENDLATLERLHSPTDIAPSVATLRRAGFRRINLDLIFGIPGQSIATWSQSLDRAIELRVEHIACYGLTYEPQTKLTAMKNHGRITPCDEDLEADMYLFAVDRLAAAGYEQYEISNFARPGEQSQHNLVYWRNAPYIGAGPSAVGCASEQPEDAVDVPASSTLRRYRNAPDIGAYIRLMDERGLAEVESETIDRFMLMNEMILMQLRLNEGLSIDAFRSRCGVDPLVVFEPALTKLVGAGQIDVSPTHVALTRAGRLLTNAIMTELAAACDANITAQRTKRSVRSLPVLTAMH